MPDRPSPLARWMPHSLMLQAVILLALALGLTIVVTAAFFSRSFADQFDREIQKRGEATVKTLGKHSDLRLAISLADATQAQPVLDDLARGDEDIRYVGAFGADKRLIAYAPLTHDPAKDAATRALVEAHFDQTHGDELSRFTRGVQRLKEDSDLAVALGEQPDAQAAKKPENLGQIVLALSAANARTRLWGQTLASVGTTALLLFAFFMFYFRWVARRLNRMVKFAESVAEGDLRVTLDDAFGDELGRLATAQRSMCERTAGVVTKLVAASRSLSTASKDLSESATRQSSSASRQASSVSEMGATVAELRQTFTQATAKTEAVIDLARKSEQFSSGGSQAVGDSVARMSKLREQVGAIAVTMEGLVQKTTQIGAIIDVVNDLVEQSNVLALNAGIEAARAGEHGRGFTVVAREVRNLAERSKESTAQVRTILHDIERAVREAAHAIDEGNRRAEAGVAVANAAGGAIQRLTDAIVASSQAATQIAASTRQQSAGVEQIWQASREIDQVAAENARGTQQLEVAAANMKQLSEGMADVVGRYRT